MKWKLRAISKNLENEFIRQGKSRLLSRLLSQRNISAVSVDKFLSASYKDICHPYVLKGIKEASELFCQIALEKGSILAVGDYDVDGICSVVIVNEICRTFNLKRKIFLPSRKEHGYGLNFRSIDVIKKTFNPPNLLFVLDSGSNSENEIRDLKRWGGEGMKIIILDHHIVDSNKIAKSADVHINWHLQNDFGETCTCGELFHLIRGIRWLTKKINPQEFISLAAIGILADVSPIIGDNRIIVKNGLNNGCLNNVVASGLNSLIRTSGIRDSSLSQEDVLFKIAPRINAVGRLSKPDMAYKLLIEQNPEISDIMAQDLNEHNIERKKLQRKFETEAIQEVETNIDKFPNAIAIYNPEWPIGLVGLIASGLVEKFCRPAIVMSKNGEIIKGSGRSLENVNLKEILDGCKNVFENYGGHALAAGVTVKSHALNDVNDALNKACESYYITHGRPEEIKYYDAELRPKAITLENAEKLKNSLYPYCNRNNPEPIFKLSDVTIVEPDLYERNDWKILSFYVSKDGVKTGVKFKMFSDDLGTEIADRKADVYFSFPQSFIYPAINVLELIFKK